MDKTQVDAWLVQAEQTELVLKVDLEEQKITDQSGKEISFEIPSYHKKKLLNGWDDIALTLHHEGKISAFENNR